MLSTLRFLRHYLRPSPAAVEREEAGYRREGEMLEATVFRPARSAGPFPGWVLLHGLTYTGREHPSLVRFARGLAAAGFLVFVPDIPEWRALRMAPEISVETIKAALRALAGRRDVVRGRTGVIGFSFGATQALVASTDPDLRDDFAGIAAWGGYFDVERLFRFAVTGEHDLDGHRYQVAPDPYGRWVVGSTYLTALPGHENDDDVAAALLALAEEAGKRQVYAGEAVYDDAKRRLRARLPAGKHHTFDLFAAPAGEEPPAAEREELAARLAAVAHARDPMIDPAPYLPRVTVPTVVAHARDDRLIPFTEGLRLCRALPPATVVDCQVLKLFSHSGGAHESLGPAGLVRETLRFAHLLNRILSLL